MTGAEIIPALAIAADGVPVKAVYCHSIHDAGVLRNIRLIPHHGAHFILGAAVITLAIPAICSRKRIDTSIDGFVVAVGAGYFDDNNLVVTAFYDLYIAVRKDIYIDDGVIIEYNRRKYWQKPSMSPRCYGADRLALFWLLCGCSPYICLIV